jgi:hypothetical protein
MEVLKMRSRFRRTSIYFCSSKTRFLEVFSPAAKYNLKKYIISCINVPFINVADARLYPDSGKVIIHKNAVMDTLKNAIIMANTVTKYHNIRNVTANVFGRKSYLATGDYQYLDENKKPYLIKFNKIKPDTMDKLYLKVIYQ